MHGPSSQQRAHPLGGGFGGDTEFAIQHLGRGRLPRIAVWRDDWYRDLLEPEPALAHLAAHGPRADLFTFVQRLPDTKPRFPYPWESDNVAAIEISSFNDWWMNRIPKTARKHVRRCMRLVLFTAPALG